MITAVVGAGGKTTLIHKLAEKYLSEGKKVFVTTSTHMFIEDDTLLTDNADKIISVLEEKGYAMAGTKQGEKITELSQETYKKVCEHADVVLIEADGSKHMPLKYPRDNEPVIYDNVENIIIVAGLHALNQKAEDVCFRMDEIKKHTDITEETIIKPSHIEELIKKGYIDKMIELYPEKKLSIHIANNGSLYERALASLLEAGLSTDLLNKEWFAEKPVMFICGAGHVAHELAVFADRLNFKVNVIDSREDLANKDRYPFVENLICDSFDNLDKYLVPNAFYVVVTPGHEGDFQCVKSILKSDYRYLGMIGSKIKVANTFNRLKNAGFTDEEIGTVHAPIGLKIKAETPAEIAVSILAEVILEKNKVSSSSISTELLNTDKHGVLCIVIDKKGSAPRGKGSMMLVTDNETIDTIGGGAAENKAIEDARLYKKAMVKEYQLNNKEAQNLGMICGGSQTVLFLPI